MKKDEVEVDESLTRIRVQNVWYNVGQFIFLEDNLLSSNIKKNNSNIRLKE